MATPQHAVPIKKVLVYTWNNINRMNLRLEWLLFGNTPKNPVLMVVSSASFMFA